MAAPEVKGQLVVVLVGDTADNPTTWTALEGQTTARLSLSATTVDTMDKSKGGWETKLAMTRTGTVSVSGNLYVTRPMFDKLEAACVGGTTHHCRIMKDATKGYAGDFSVSMEIDGDSSDVAKYSITLEPAGALTAVPGE